MMNVMARLASCKKRIGEDGRIRGGGRRRKGERRGV
jgi:hypothetical protein